MGGAPQAVTPPIVPLRRPGRVAAVALAGLVGSGLVALLRPVPAWELELTRIVNGAPDAVAAPLYPVMQLGTLAAPLLAALLLLVVRRDALLAGAALVAGLMAWFGAKAVKRIVERGRPLAYVSDLDVREGTGAGLGFVSGHSAVAAATAVVVMVAVPPRWRPALVVVVLVVGVARIVYGVHLPADVVGGWSFGALVGLAAVGGAERLATRRRPESQM